MRLCVCAVLLMCCLCLLRVNCSLPLFTPAVPPQQVQVSMNLDSAVTAEHLRRLPGLCRRLKRRRVTMLCNLEKFCWRGRSHGSSDGWSLKSYSGQVCVCPRGARCSRFFDHSL